MERSGISNLLPALTLATWLLPVTSAFGAEPTFLGVLDERQCAEAKDQRARIMFVHNEDGWMSLLNSNIQERYQIPLQKWTVGFDGKALGTLSLSDPSSGSPQPTDWFYARDKLFLPVGKAPSVTNSTKAFAGWCGAPHTRPLVLVSKPNVSDPAGWKPFLVGPEYKQKLYVALKLVLGRANVRNCKSPYENIGRLYEYQADDVKLYTGYRSGSDGILISIGLDSKKYKCDGPTDSSWLARWFLIRGEDIDYIGTSMELVDAGDYDGDGKSELLFWSRGYDKDGYVLFFNDLRQKAEYTWIYH